MGSNRQNCDRKRSTSERDDHQLARLAKKNRFCSSKRLAGMWKETGVVEWRHLTEQHMEGCMNRGFRCRIPAVKPLLNGRQRQKRLKWCREKKERKKKDDRAMVFSHVFRRVQVCYFFWKQRSQNVEEKRWTEHERTQMAASSEMWSFHNQLWFGGRCHQLVLVTSASSSLLLMQQFTKISWNISWCQLPINSLEITSSSSSRILLHRTLQNPHKHSVRIATYMC